MIDFSEVRRALISWVQSELEIDCIWEDQGAPRPNLPYASAKIISGPRRSGSDEIRRKAGPVYYVAGMRQITLSVQVYGAEALNKVSQLQTSLEKPSVLGTLRTYGIAFVRAEAVNDTATALDNRFESRAQMDVILSVVDNDDDDIDYISNVEVVNQVDGSTSTISI